nr:ATP-binding protein [Hymenobacter nitidus]
MRRTATFDDPEEDKLLRLVDESIRDLTTTVTDLSAVVQVDRATGEQSTEPVSLPDLTADVLQTLRPQLLTVHGSVDTDFAAQSEVVAVRSSLRTILLNLLANAIKYRHPERAPQVCIRSRQASGQSIIEIQDNGLGIDLEKHGTEMFHLFRRFHPEAGEGTGVGLFLVNRLVQAQGGRIEVESQLNVGTLFRIYLSQP